MVIDFLRARVIHPSGTISPGRFVFRDGTAAVWAESSTRPPTASRILHADGTYTPGLTDRRPSTFTTTSNETWTVIRLPGGG